MDSLYVLMCFYLMILFQIRTRVCGAIGYGSKFLVGDKDWELPHRDMEWFWNPVRASGLSPLLSTNYPEINNACITALIERWHPETSSFHLPVGEMTITLDDVQCLLHVPIVGKLLTFPQKVTMLDGVNWMVELLGMDEEAAQTEARDCGGSYIRPSTLSLVYLQHAGYVYYVLEYGEDPEGRFEHHSHCMIRCFLLYLLGHTLFTNRSKKHLDLGYVEAFRDVYTIGEYAWGAIGLAVLYQNLNDATRLSTKTCGGYMSLLLVQHFLYAI